MEDKNITRLEALAVKIDCLDRSDNQKLNELTELYNKLEQYYLRDKGDYGQATRVYPKLRNFLDISTNEYVLVSYLSSASSGLYDSIWVSVTQSQLAKIVGVTRDSINKMIVRLVDKGLLKKVKLSNLDTPSNTIYSVTDKWIHAYLNFI